MLFNQGLEHSAAQRWQEAYDAFSRSAELTPRPSTYFNLAVSALELGRAAEAIAAIDRFEALADRAAHAQYVQSASDLRARANALLEATHDTAHAPEPAIAPAAATVPPAANVERKLDASLRRSPPHKPERSRDEGSLWREPLTWVVIGTLVAGAAGGMIYVLAQSDDDEPGYAGTTGTTF